MCACCSCKAHCMYLKRASKIVTDADNHSHMLALPVPYAYYTLNKPMPAAQDETYGLRRKILGLRPLPPRNFRNRTTKKSCAFNVTGVLITERSQSFANTNTSWTHDSFSRQVKQLFSAFLKKFMFFSTIGCLYWKEKWESNAVFISLFHFLLLCTK